MRKRKFLACVMAVTIALSTIPAFAVETNPDDPSGSIDEAKNSLAKVSVTQTYNGTKKDNASHNYAKAGDDVTLTYDAKLEMTDIMASYLRPRQNQLMDAEFVIHMNVELDKLEFVKDGNVSFTFTSTFLKVLSPKEDNKTLYTVDYIGADKETNPGFTLYEYKITVDPDNLKKDNNKTSFDVNAALITYVPENTENEPLCLSEIIATENADAMKATSLSSRMGDTNAAWMQPITLKLATLTPTQSTKDKVIKGRETVTVKASGTIDGSFTYATHDKMETIENIVQTKKNVNHYYKTLNFGIKDENGDPSLDENGKPITGWTSNEVVTKLYYQSGGSTDPTPPLC